jgi:putative ABC transport system permease protein
MMAAHSTNRYMFRRLVRRLLFANRGRLFVVLLALSAGAAVSAALLNLQFDAKRRLNSDFSIFGPSIIIAPLSTSPSFSPDATLNEEVLKQIARVPPGNYPAHPHVTLYLIVEITNARSKEAFRAVLAGTRISNFDRYPAPASESQASNDKLLCTAGPKLATQEHLLPGDILVLHNAGREERCTVSKVFVSLESNDSQLVTSLGAVQRLAALPGRASIAQITFLGTPEQFNSYVDALQKELPDAEVRPLRQFTEAQSKIYSRISGLLAAATAIILILTVLCVMAAMTNIAAERKQDVGMMKAIGGSARGILNLFLTEAVLLGLIGGLIGATAGIALSMVLGKAVFGVAALPRLLVYPISVTLTVIVAILGAYPLRMLAHVRPATIFRGEA